MYLVPCHTVHALERLVSRVLVSGSAEEGYNHARDFKCPFATIERKVEAAPALNRPGGQEGTSPICGAVNPP